ncbi:MAG: hypothetical protein U0835_24885 [Isosphaeraceae bacterium]
MLDRAGNPVPSQLLRRDASGFTVQVPQAEPNTWYLVRVSAFDPAGLRATGGYFLGVSPGAPPLPLAPFAEGTLDQGRGQDFRTLKVLSPRLFHFDLAASSGAAGAVVRATIYDASRKPVASFNTAVGSAEVFLPAGSYTVRFVGGTSSGGPLPTTTYRLRGLVRSEAIGPQLIDTTALPVTPLPWIDTTDAYTWGQDDYLTYVYYLTLTDIGALP